jgi:tyrosine-specific transport protein
MTKNFIFAVATLIGAIVGLGMFGIPYSAAKAGFFVGIAYIIILGIVTLLLHLIYGEIVERTKEKQRLTGDIEKYFGKKWKKIIGIAIIFSIYAALLAYIIVGGKFLALLFADFANPFVFSIIFWLILSTAVWRGIRTIAEIELLMTFLLILFVIILFIWGAGDISFKNLPEFNLSNIFLPYGIVLFAFSGIFAIPEIRELLKTDGKYYKRAIIWGSVIPIFIYLLFTIMVVGISGENTSEEAIEGLSQYLGMGITRFGAIFGLLAIATSYLVLGVNLKHTFEYDWRIKPRISAGLVIFAPIILFIAGLQQFIGIISFSGAVFGAITGIFIILIYQRAIKSGDKKPSYTLNLSKYVRWGLITLWALGGAYEIIYLLI